MKDPLTEALSGDLNEGVRMKAGTYAKMRDSMYLRDEVW